MADLIQLYRLEEVLEDAAKAILEAGSVRALTQRSEEKRELPCVGLQAQIGKQTGHKAANGRRDAWEAKLTATLISDRATDNASHDLLRATVRALLGDVTQWTGPANHAVADVMEEGSTPEIDGENDCDVSGVVFAMVVNIKPGAWPA